jgi:hypothetical protein
MTKMYNVHYLDIHIYTFWLILVENEITRLLLVNIWYICVTCFLNLPQSHAILIQQSHYFWVGCFLGVILHYVVKGELCVVIWWKGENIFYRFDLWQIICVASRMKWFIKNKVVERVKISFFVCYKTWNWPLYSSAEFETNSKKN